MIQSFVQFGETSSSGLGALGLDGKAFIIQLVTFVLAFLVLKKWAFGPIVSMMERRRKTIEQGVALGEQMKKDKAAMDAKIADELHKARLQADKILADAQDSGRQAIREAEEAARNKAESILTAADARIKQDTALAKKRLERDLASLVADATEAIIHEKVDARKDADLVDRAIRESANS